MTSLCIDVNPELGKPQGSYFGLIVTDGYDWNQCYSWAWECKNYWDKNSKTGQSRSVHDAFPDIDWKEDQVGLMHQVIAINSGLTDRPEKRFWERVVVDDVIGGGEAV